MINHISERLKTKGYEQNADDIRHVPGKYVKRTVFLQGYAYNVLGLSNIVIEHNRDRWYDHRSEEALTHAVDCYGNFMIETARACLGGEGCKKRLK